MAASYVLRGLLVVISLSNAFALELPTLTDLPLPVELIAKCNRICANTFTSNSSAVENSNGVETQEDTCDRGCRFFAIAHMLATNSGLATNISSSACHDCCDESYKGKVFESCNSGCKFMGSVIKSSASSSEEFVVIPYQQVSQEEPVVSIAIYFDLGASEEETAAVQPVADVEPDYVLTDPGLRHQVSSNVADTKLPEVKVKTLPVESETSGPTLVPATSCYSWVNSLIDVRTIPSCIIIMLLLFILFALFRFLISCEFRTRNQIIGYAPQFDDMNTSLTKSVYSTPSKSTPVTIIVDSDKTTALPPNTVHKVPPPKYDEAMLQEGDIIIKKSQLM